MLAGACLGFLPHNFSPARIFMGDSGSMLVGLMLPAARYRDRGRSTRSRSTPRPTLLPLALPLLVPIAMLFIPFIDLVLAVVRRTRRGQSPFSPDKMHLHHRLLCIGHSHRRAVLVMYFWAALLSFGAVALSITGGRAELLVAVAVLLVVGVVVVLSPRARRAAREARAAELVAQKRAQPRRPPDRPGGAHDAAAPQPAASARPHRGPPAGRPPVRCPRRRTPAGTSRSCGVGALVTAGVAVVAARSPGWSAAGRPPSGCSRRGRRDGVLLPSPAW